MNKDPQIKQMPEDASKSSQSSSEQLRVRHGKLSERSVSELLFFAFTTGWDGTLTCSCKGMIKSLRFKAGKLLEARSNDPSDSSAWILTEMGILDKSFRIDPVPETEKFLPGNTMKLLSEQIQLGKMQPSEIDEFMHRRVRKILHDLMSWREGDYVLELSKIPRAEPPLKVYRSIPEMLLREMKSVPDPVGLRELLENPDIQIDPISDDLKFKESIHLTTIEQRILKSISSPMSVKQVSKLEGLGLEATARLLLGLHVVSLLRANYRSKGKPKTIHSSEPEKPRHISSDRPEPAENHLVQTKDSKQAVTDSDAKEYLFDYAVKSIQAGFDWDPYKILQVETTASSEHIEAEYHRLTDIITEKAKKANREEKEYFVSLIALLEESRTILLNNTFRTRFDMLRSIVDLTKKLKAAAAEQQKALQAFKDKRIPLAIVHAKFALYLDPRNSEYHYKLIYMMAQNRRLWMMARLLQEYALESFGTNAHILALSGFLFHRIGDRTRARLEYERALQIDSEHDLAIQGLATLNKDVSIT